MRHDGRRGHPRPRCLRREPTYTTVSLAVPGRGRAGAPRGGGWRRRVPAKWAEARDED